MKYKNTNMRIFRASAMFALLNIFTGSVAFADTDSSSYTPSYTLEEVTSSNPSDGLTITKYATDDNGNYLFDDDGNLIEVEYNVVFDTLGDTTDGSAVYYEISSSGALSEGNSGDYDLLVYSSNEDPLVTTESKDLGDIYFSYVGSSASSTSNSRGGGIANYFYNTSDKTITIDSISGDFVANHGTWAGAILNYAYGSNLNINIGDITSNFIGNYATYYGGAIVNFVGGGTGITNSNITINSIKGDFIGNYTTTSDSYGAGIWNRVSDITYSSITINSIEGDFISNKINLDGNGTAMGGAICNNFYSTTGSKIYIGEIIGDFIENEATSTSSWGGYGGAICNHIAYYTSGSTMQIEYINGDFISNYSNKHGGAISNLILSGSSNSSIIMDLIEGDFINNSTDTNGGAIYNCVSDTTLPSNSTITMNVVGDFIENNSTNGGAIYNYSYGTNNNSSVSVEGDFINNYSTQNGGAIYNGTGSTSSSSIIVEGSFVGNYIVSYYGCGGAVYNDGGVVTFSANEGNVYSYGNWTGSSLSNRTDVRGGFLYFAYAGGTANFDIGDGYTMTIGDGTTGYDSIASYNNGNSTINKTGDGTLTVNSSMQYFYGTLNVQEGTMNVNNILGASVIDIDSGATLALTINAAKTLSNTSLTYTNDGTLQLIAGVSLDAGSYSISASGVTDFADSGSVVAYGGTYANGKFTMGSVANATVDEDGNEATFDASTITSNSNIKIVKDSTTDVVDVMLSFNLVEDSSITGSTGSTVTATDVTDSTVIDDMKTLSAWDFDIVLDDGDTVVLTYYIGFVEDSSLLALYHIDGSTKTDESDSIISYDGEYIVFEVDSFSTWAVVSVPEPSTYAMIFGALALGLAAYRRRK